MASKEESAGAQPRAINEMISHYHCNIAHALFTRGLACFLHNEFGSTSDRMVAFRLAGGRDARGQSIAVRTAAQFAWHIGDLMDGNKVYRRRPRVSIAQSTQGTR